MSDWAEFFHEILREFSAMRSHAELLVTKRCKRPDQDKPYTFSQDRDYYNPGEEVTVMCKEEGYRPSHQKVKCVAYSGRDDWEYSPSCIERCKRPDQDEPYTFSQDRDYYNPGEVVTVLCKEEGHRPSHPNITCVTSGGKDNWDNSPSCIGVTVTDVAATSTSISFWTSCSPDCPPGWGFTTTCCDETTSPPSCNSSSDGRNVTFSSLQPLALYRITTTLHSDETSHLIWSSNITTQKSDLPRERTDDASMLRLLLWIYNPFLLLKLLAAVTIAVIPGIPWKQQKYTRAKRR
ncbi:uncharacterized protein [Hyperolius riggenbachi]|uniref:uncharacterized protein n=1 Tax=Hyperolius riggenbachi TaxID=752182 RepID=UPI0035A2DA29